MLVLETSFMGYLFLILPIFCLPTLSQIFTPVLKCIQVMIVLLPSNTLPNMSSCLKMCQIHDCLATFQPLPNISSCLKMCQGHDSLLVDNSKSRIVHDSICIVHSLSANRCMIVISFNSQQRIICGSYSIAHSLSAERCRDSSYAVSWNNIHHLTMQDHWRSRIFSFSRQSPWSLRSLFCVYSHISIIGVLEEISGHHSFVPVLLFSRVGQMLGCPPLVQAYFLHLLMLTVLERFIFLQNMWNDVTHLPTPPPPNPLFFPVPGDVVWIYTFLNMGENRRFTYSPCLVA